MTIFHCPTESRFLQIRTAIADHIASHGHAVIEAWDFEAATLRAIAERAQVLERAAARALQ